MNKELINLQRNSKATCAIVKTGEHKELSPAVIMSASVSNKFMYVGGLPPFAEKINKKAAKHEIVYFVITNIDKASKENQQRFVGLVKDKHIDGYDIPNNCIVVFTVKDETTLKNIIPELYHFAVVAF